VQGLSAVRAKMNVSLVQAPSGVASLLISGVEEVGGGSSENALGENEARFRYLAQNSSGIIALLRLDGSSHS
jgi:hypothetical protein